MSGRVRYFWEKKKGDTIHMKTDHACLPLVFQPRLTRNPVLDIRLGRKPRQRAIGRKTGRVSSLLSRIGKRRDPVDDRGMSPVALLGGGGDGEGEGHDACRSFEKYLMEVILEEGRVGDLRDVEELLLCWNNLLCPVLADIVATFYVEACKELFTTTQ